MDIFVIKPPYLKEISELIGVPEPKVNLIFLQLFTIPLSFINYYITSPLIRLIYSLVLGLLLQYSIYGINFLHTFSSTVFTYLFIRFFGRKQSAFWVLIITVLHLSFLHIYRMVFDYGGWRLDDPTTIYMMTICKFSSLAFSYEDGGKDDKDIKNEHMRTNKVIERPSFLEICSFVYFYPTAIIGPGIEYRDFIDFIYLRNCYSKMPNRPMLTQGALYLLFSFVFMFGYAMLSPQVPMDYIGKVEFGQHSILYKLFYLSISLILGRSMYYSSWVLSYSCLIFNGLSTTETKKTDPKTKEVTTVIEFEKGSYGSFFIAEFGSNAKTKLIAWNHSVHLWLKYNLYLRTININMKPFKDNFGLASLLTFITSAFWHGYYPVYYITFICFHFLQISNEVFDKKGLYVYIEKNIVLRALSSFFTLTMFNLIGVIFFNLRWSLFVQAMKNTYWFMFIAIGVMYVVSKALPRQTRISTPKPNELVNKTDSNIKKTQ